MAAIPTENNEQQSSFNNSDLDKYSSAQAAPVSFSPQAVTGGQPGMTKGMSAVDDILSRVVTGTQQAQNYANGQLRSEMSGSRETLGNDMADYRKRMDAHQAAIPTLTPWQAASMGITQDRRASSITKRNAFADVALFSNQQAQHQQKGALMQSEYDTLMKMQGQQYGQLDATGNSLANQTKTYGGIYEDTAKQGMALQAMPTAITKGQADIAHTNAQTGQIQATTAQTKATTAQTKAATAQLNADGMTKKDKMDMVKQHEAHIANAEKTLATLQSKRLSGGALTDDDKAISDQMEKEIAQKKAAIRGIDPVYAKKTGIPTEEDEANTTNLKSVRKYVDGANKAASKNGIFSTGQQQNDPQFMADELYKAGHKLGDIQAVLGDKVTPTQLMKAATPKNTKPAKQRKPLGSFETSQATSVSGVRG